MTGSSQNHQYNKWGGFTSQENCSLTVLSRYNSDATQFTNVKYKGQWLLVYSQSCTSIIILSKHVYCLQKVYSLPLPRLPLLFYFVSVNGATSICLFKQGLREHFVMFLLFFTYSIQLILSSHSLPQVQPLFSIPATPSHNQVNSSFNLDSFTLHLPPVPPSTMLTL